MKLFLKIFKIVAVLIIAATITLFAASFLMQDKVAGIILNSLSKNISTKFEFGSVRLSFLKKFPKASLELKNVLVHSSQGYNKACFAGINTDTLLSARSVSIEFSIKDIVKGIYNIDRVSIKEGRLFLYIDTSGNVNYEIAVASTKKSETDFTINLERINLSELKAVYNNLATKLMIGGSVKEGSLKTRISGDEIDFTADGEMDINLFKLFNFTIEKPVRAVVDINLNSSEKGTVFSKSILAFNNYKFGLTGFVSSDDLLDLSLTGENIDISGIKEYLPDKYLEKISSYNPAGILNIESRIRGPMTRISNPGVEITFILEKGSVTYGNSEININNVSFKGSFTNGPLMAPKTSCLSIRDFIGTLGSAQYSGAMILSDFDSLKGDLQLRGRVIPSEFKEYFNLKNISSAEGAIDFNLKMKGFIPKKEKYSITDVLCLDPVADLNFEGFGIGLRNDRIKVNQVNGKIIFSDTVMAQSFKFIYKNQEFDIDGMFYNLPEWIEGQQVMLIASADISCRKLMPELLFEISPGADTSSIKKTAYSLPGDVILDLHFKIDELTYKTFQAEKISGSLSYKPGILNFKTLKLNSLDGVISGNGFLIQNTNKTFIGRASLDLENININKTFTSFKNFGQEFIKAENLTGKLSGTLSLLLPTDSLLKPVIKSITAEGKYFITDGGLINFEPVKELSSFIELSELENIHFEKLENDFFIRNNILFTPQMDVKSSAADLTINGKHSFDNDYEYHIKILLSEILSKKLKKQKQNTNEFGAVMDDGLGRTSLLLKIENKGDEVKVGYDIKAAGSQVKNDIRAERQTLKTILNQEYGWFKNDSAVNQKKTTSSPRFRITWEETDTLKVEPETPEIKKESPIKNFFKKKQ